MSFSQAKPLLIGRGPNSTPVFSGGYVDVLMPDDIADGEASRMINMRLEGQYTVPRKGRQAFYTDPSNFFMCGSAHFLGNTYVACQRALQPNVLLYDTVTGVTSTYGSFSTTSGTKWSMFEGIYRTTGFPLPVDIIEDTQETIRNAGGTITSTSAGTKTTTVAQQTPAQLNNLLTTPASDIRKALFVLDQGTSGHALYESGGSILEGFSMSPTFSSCRLGTWFNNRAWYAGRPGFENVLYLSMTNAGNWFGGDIHPKLADMYTMTFPNPIRGLVKTEFSLFVFMENQIAVIDADDQISLNGFPVYRSKPIHAKEGILSNNYTYAVGNAVYYYSKSGKICRITRGSSADGHFEVQEISHHPTRGIKGYMSIIENSQNTVGFTLPYFFAYDSRNNLLKFHCQRTTGNPIAGVTENDTVIIYDLSRECFLIDELYSGSVGGSVHGVSVGGEVYLLGNLSRKLMKDESGYTDNGDSIYVQRRSKLFDMGDWSRKKELWQARTVYQGLASASITQTIFVHDETTKTKQKVLNTLKKTPGGGRNLIGVQTSILYQPISSLFSPLGSSGGTMSTYYCVIEKSDLGLRGYAVEVLWEATITSQGDFFRLQSFDMTMEYLDQKVSSPS